MASVALLSNPHSTGNRALLPRVREYCARHPDIFHYEVEEISQIPDAMRTIAPPVAGPFLTTFIDARRAKPWPRWWEGNARAGPW